VIGFGEEEDVRVVSGGKVVDIHDGGVWAPGVEVDEVKWLGDVVREGQLPLNK
jgi:hypothetical protein